MNISLRYLFPCVLVVTAAGTLAGPYSLGLNDSANTFDAPVPGFIGPHGLGKARLDNGSGPIIHPENYVNPLFFAWASSVESYERSDTDVGFNDTDAALGPVTGNHFDVVSLGDLSAAQISSGDPQGRITLTFPQPIRNRSGADFVVYENGFLSAYNLGGAGIGGIFADLAHVEVSSDGVTFHRFPSTSLTATAVGFYGLIDSTNVFGLAGKHVNNSSNSWGTPFDIGILGLTEVTHIRVVDLPGNGSFVDSSGNSIYDAWQTAGSGGFDLEAVGAISIDMSYDQWPSLDQIPIAQRSEIADPDHDGISNLLEYAFGLEPWKPDPPATGWISELVTDSATKFIKLTTLRDERLLDITREIQWSHDLSSWETLALSAAGAPFHAVNGFSLNISEESASQIASVKVIRKDHLQDLRPVEGAQRRFYRIKVTKTAP